MHLAPYTLVAGGEPGVLIEIHVTCAYGVKIFSQSDDYSGESLTNSLLPKKYKNEIKKKVILKKHSIIGTKFNCNARRITGGGHSDRRI